MPLGLFSECSDLLPVYKWTYVIHRLNELNKKIEMPPQNLTAEVSEPKKKKKGRRVAEKRGWRKASISHSSTQPPNILLPVQNQ